MDRRNSGLDASCPCWLATRPCHGFRRSSSVHPGKNARPARRQGQNQSSTSHTSENGRPLEGDCNPEDVPLGGAVSPADLVARPGSPSAQTGRDPGSRFFIHFELPPSPLPLPGLVPATRTIIKVRSRRSPAARALASSPLTLSLAFRHTSTITMPLECAMLADSAASTLKPKKRRCAEDQGVVLTRFIGTMNSAIASSRE